MQIDRRDFVKLGALVAAARIEAAATPCVAAPIPLHAMRICNTAYRRRVDDDFMQDVAEDLNAQRFVRLVGETSGLEPVFMAAGLIQTATRDEAFIGQPLRIKPCIDRGMMTFAYETLEGRRLGVDHSMSGKLIGRMAEAGLILGAVVLPGPLWNKQLWASAYLIS